MTSIRIVGRSPTYHVVRANDGKWAIVVKLDGRWIEFTSETEPKPVGHVQLALEFNENGEEKTIAKS
jgi:hypothetical protein